jgi:pimeloyl-ACP methyl ester carboxylesterase
MTPLLEARIFRSPRHTTRYWEAGPVDGPLIMFIHGWPGIGLIWRAQMEALASEGWRCVAPDLRGYGGSAAPIDIEAYALRHIVEDMLELHDHLGNQPAIWVGHDWGSPVAGLVAAHHRARSRGTVLIALPYFPTSFALPTLRPLIDRALYPADRFPEGQWDYFRFYQTDFEQTVSDLEADIPATLASIYRRGDPETVGHVSAAASVALRGGRFGKAHRAPAAAPDPALWPPADFETLVEAFRRHGFRAANASYLHDSANTAYASAAPENGRLSDPVLFINGDWDAICDITRNRLGAPMRAACRDLSVVSLPGGHWLPLECKTGVLESIRSWLETRGLRSMISS